MMAMPLTSVDEESAYPERFTSAELVDYLVRRHHEPLRDSLPALQLMAARAGSRSGRHATSLREVERLLGELIVAILPHLDEEESYVFPVLSGARAATPSFGRVLAAMREEGHTVRHLGHRLRFATDGFRAPSDATAEHAVLYRQLEQLVEALSVHVAIELDVLLYRWGTRRP